MSINTNLLYIGQAGIYNFYAPFNTAYNLDSDILTVESIQSIGELISRSIDIQAIYFTPFGLTQTQYQQFIQNNGVMVSLKDSAGNRYTVPSTFIQGLPDPNGVPYRILGLNIVLGPLPTTFNVQPLLSVLNEMIAGIVGINPGITPVELGRVKLIDTLTAEQMESTRMAAASGFNTVGYYMDQLNIAQQQIQALESYILNVLSPNPSTGELIGTGLTLTNVEQIP